MLSNTAVMPERGQARVARCAAAGAVVVRGLAHVGREPDRVIVQADDDVLVVEADRAGRLLLVEPEVV